MVKQPHQKEVPTVWGAGGEESGKWGVSLLLILERTGTRKDALQLDPIYNQSSLGESPLLRDPVS